jgi:hypothetical protein
MQEYAAMITENDCREQNSDSFFSVASNISTRSHHFKTSSKSSIIDVFPCLPTLHATMLSPPKLTRSGEHSYLHNHDHYSSSVPWPLEQLPCISRHEHSSAPSDIRQSSTLSSCNAHSASVRFRPWPALHRSCRMHHRAVLREPS